MRDTTLIRYEQEVFRKLIHLSSLWMVLAMLYLPKWPLVILFAVLLGLNILVEYAYSQGWPLIAPVYGRLFRRMLRNEPQPGQIVVSGAPPVLASAMMTTALFPQDIAAAAFAVMLLGDTAAALIGRKWHWFRRLRNGKSWEGFIGFIGAGLVVVAAGYLLSSWDWRLIATGIAAVILSAFAELFGDRVKFDDNFSIPLIMGGVLYLGKLCFCA